MYLRSAFLPLLLTLLTFQVQGDLFRRHYEAAQNYHRAGNFHAAEAEFKIIIAEANLRLGRIYTAQGNYSAAVDALESATSTLNVTPGLIDLSIAYFQMGEYQKAIAALQRA